MRIALTGATGFIGRALALRLAARGDAVLAIARAGSEVSGLAAGGASIAVHRHDGSTASLQAALAAFAPDAVVHVASLFLAQHGPEDVQRLVESNVAFPAQLLEAMAGAGIGRLVSTGTSWQHLDDADYDPVNLYASTKQAFESVLAYYVAARGLSAATLKLFDTYGPGDTRRKLFALLRDAARGGTPLRMSPGAQAIDLVYVDDVVDAFLAALAHVATRPPGTAETFGVGAGTRLPLRELVDVYARVVGRPLAIEWGALPYRPREVMRPWTRWAPPPGWRPRVGLEDGIGRMERDASIGGLLAAPAP